MPSATTDRSATPTDAAFLAAMAGLAGGVCVVTTAGPEGRPAGFTSTAVMSLSRSPQLLAIGVDQASRTLPALLGRGRFALNILRADGESLSRRFADRTADRFAGLDWTTDEWDVPVLAAYSAAVLSCQVVRDVPAGDHRLIVASVRRVLPGAEGGGALVHLGRRYHQLPAEYAR
ncbi:flavin reductase family protein [Streptomyces millisiae]|uniref:Flavin reductase family protein n=1 Tax=Streptomyces millisiae TaxID=3075542 RepID=A0ABU2LHQ1_9ACTN|nr:flavin reductase family protein [Streptomyces sp. DSM 44918]MDT0317114.1 flavin reductase family protein [Streptomyces sp. DSM 44918]